MDQYKELIKRIYNGLSEKDGFFVNNPILPALEEHSLWTYWQGRGVRNPKIMVVGQDWGSKAQSDKYCSYIKSYPDESVVSFEQIRQVTKLKAREFTTDKQLRNIMNDIFGYPDICKEKIEELYFTNLIPGYRKEGKSTGNSTEVKRWIYDDENHILDNFNELLEILKPQYLICLGCLVSESIAGKYGNDIVFKNKSYNEFLDEELDPKEVKPIKIKLESGHNIIMFAMPHLGGLGKANRNKYLNKKEDNRSFDDDWKVVAKYINNA